jgi:hypothetical protein
MKEETMKEETMKLRVKIGTVELPHRVGNVEMVPDGEFPKLKAEALLKTYPQLYEKAEGKPALDKYTFKKKFQVNEVQKVIDALSEEGRADVYEYAKKVLVAEQKPKKAEETKKDIKSK